MFTASNIQRILIALVSFLNISGICHENKVLAQSFHPPANIIELKGHYGFVMAHHPRMRHLQQKHTSTYEISFAKQTNGFKHWHQYHNFPIKGIIFMHTDFGNRDILGKANALGVFLNFHLYSSFTTELNFRLTSGLAYISKCFDRYDNYKNIAIGSHVNMVYNMLYEFKFNIPHNLQASVGLSLSHFSNGVIKTPNLGLNVPAIHIGAAYKFNTRRNTATTIKADSNSLRKHIFVIASFGTKQLYPANGDRFSAYSLSAGYSYPLNFKRRLVFGCDMFLDYSNLRSLERLNESPKQEYKILKNGLFFGQELVFSKLTFLTHLGYYYHTLYKGDGLIYSRVGIKYNLSSNLLANLSLKTHYFKADFIECGFGYQIKL